jgi:hypothetical protein
MAGKDKLESLLKELYRKGRRLARRRTAEWHDVLTLPRLAEEPRGSIYFSPSFW